MVGVGAEEANADKSCKILNGRWVLSNKGDNASPDCRARYVACEIHTYEDSFFFAATPPLEATMILIPQMATERFRDGHTLKIQIPDARKA